MTNRNQSLVFRLLLRQQIVFIRLLCCVTTSELKTNQSLRGTKMIYIIELVLIRMDKSDSECVNIASDEKGVLLKKRYTVYLT